MARVTVINDNPEFLGLMGDLLEIGGHDATTLRGEDVTIEAIAETEPQIVIVDLRLDNAKLLGDGWAVVVGCRAHQALSNVPIVLCSADPVYLRERADEIAALADVHPLSKPFSIDDVESLLNGLLARAE